MIEADEWGIYKWHSELELWILIENQEEAKKVFRRELIQTKIMAAADTGWTGIIFEPNIPERFALMICCDLSHVVDVRGSAGFAGKTIPCRVTRRAVVGSKQKEQALTK